MRAAFNIRLWFALTAFVVVGLIAAVSAWSVTQFITRSLLERESEVSQEFFQGIVAVEGDDVFLRGPATPEGDTPLSAFARHVLGTPGVMRANVYSAERRVLWSTEPKLVGETFADNAELAAALRGARITEINSLDAGKSEYVAFGQSGLFIEAYLPIRSTVDRRVIGAVELYKFPTALNATIAAGRDMIWFSAAVAAIVLWGSLYWIVQRGAAQIDRQQRQLREIQTVAVIGELAGAVAHSLRNPMASVRSSAELWRSELPPGHTGPVDDVIAEIDRMDVYVRDLLAYAHPDPARLRPIDPMAVIDAALTRCTAALARNRVVLDRRDHRDRPTTVTVDPLLFEHALTSLLTNAVEAMPDGGRLVVDCASATGHTTLTLADTGVGISAEHLERLARTRFTTKSGGLGLGLALARGAIERWGGRLTMTSRPGEGTTMTIELTES